MTYSVQQNKIPFKQFSTISNFHVWSTQMGMILMCASTHIIGNWSSSRLQKLPLLTCDVIGLCMTLITVPFSLRALRFICCWLHLLFYRLYSLPPIGNAINQCIPAFAVFTKNRLHAVLYLAGVVYLALKTG